MIASPKQSQPWPEWIDEQLIEQTKAVWGPHYGRTLTTAEAVEILLNVGRLLDAIEEQSS